MHAAAFTADRRSSFSRRSRHALAKAFLLAVCLALLFPAQLSAQATPPPPTGSSSATQATTQNPSPAQQKPAPVTTTVIVHGEVEDNYLPESITVGTLDGAELKNTPFSASVVTRDLLNDQVSRLLSDVIQNDASVGDDYVPVGYYGDYQIRGFPIDLATGF
jgi:iron complex outermembrane receptor protein